MSTETKKKMSGLDEIITLLNSRRKCILVQTFEEERLQQDLTLVANQKDYEAHSWSVTSGAYDILTNKESFKTGDPIKFMRQIKDYDEQAMFILKDFHDIWSNYQAKRALRDYLEAPPSSNKSFKPIIIISHQADVPAELEKLVTVVQYELPTKEQVVEQIEGMEDYLESKDLPKPEGREREAIIHGLTGMTLSEIIAVLKKSVAKNKRISLEEIVAEKEQVIRKTGLLEYITKLGNMDHVGGMDVFKDWLSDAKFAFDPEARKYNIDPVQGAVAAGFPGTGKSLTAKSIAHLWNLPLLKMNMSQIMDSKVGQSEKNIDRALKLAEAVSPCVLWIDELEKGLSGIASSDKSDSGTLSRVVQSLLTWLSDKEAPVFVIATANDVTKLPPELTRAGRFDEIFFVSIPSQEEREEILKIHLVKRGYSLEQDYSPVQDPSVFASSDLKVVAEHMEDFSGAEIEQVVSESGRRAYASWKKGDRESHYISSEDLISQSDQTIPMSKRNPELLADLRAWAKTSAKCASSAEHNMIHETKPEKSKLLSIGAGMSDMDLD